MTELLKALRDHSLTAEERLKVACFVWRKGDLRVGSKHSVLVKWVCEELCTAYNKKTRSDWMSVIFHLVSVPQ